MAEAEEGFSYLRESKPNLPVDLREARDAESEKAAAAEEDASGADSGLEWWWVMAEEARDRDAPILRWEGPEAENENESDEKMMILLETLTRSRENDRKRRRW